MKNIKFLLRIIFGFAFLFFVISLFMGALFVASLDDMSFEAVWYYWGGSIVLISLFFLIGKRFWLRYVTVTIFLIFVSAIIFFNPMHVCIPKMTIISREELYKKIYENYKKKGGELDINQIKFESNSKPSERSTVVYMIFGKKMHIYSISVCGHSISYQGTE